VLDPAAYRRVAGVYVLHALAPVRHRRVREFGDARHYVGEADDIARRYRQHRLGWERGRGSGSMFARAAGRQGVEFHLAAVLPQPNIWRRLELEKIVTRTPRAYCPTCRGSVH
jgi:hypothetical protein